MKQRVARPPMQANGTMQTRKARGFTLLELLVTMGIIMLTVGAIIANYNKYNESQKLKQTALTVKSNLRFAQTKAMSAQKPAVGCSQMIGYRVSFSSGSYTVQPQCIEGLIGETVSFSLPPGVTLSVSPPVPLVFRVLSRGVDISSAVVISVIGYGKTYRVQVAPSGDMTDLGFL